MRKVIKVSIPEPCHEDWGKMTTTEKGAFCKVCTKEVVDFTKAIDEDIVKHVLKHDNSCGRFTKSQLDRSLTLERSSGQKFAPLAASLLLPLTMLASAISTPEQGAAKISTYTSLGIGSLHQQADRIQITVKGNITDVNGNPLHNVKIEVKETGQTTFTDKKGSYSITFLDKETLLFSHTDFEASQRTFGNDNETFDARLAPLEYQHQIMGKMIAPKISFVEEFVTGDIEEASFVAISGTITDDNDLPLPGANIIIKGTSTGTQSDFDGNYSIVAPANSILYISYIGFSDQEIQLSNINNTIDVELNGSDVLGGMIVIAGGVSYSEIEETNSFRPFGNNNSRELSYEQQQIKKARQKKEANTLAFKKLKLAKEKKARKEKRISLNKK